MRKTLIDDVADDPSYVNRVDRWFRAGLTTEEIQVNRRPFFVDAMVRECPLQEARIRGQGADQGMSLTNLRNARAARRREDRNARNVAGGNVATGLAALVSDRAHLGEDPEHRRP